MLLLGESGTGKEVAARLVHAHSPRRTKPFVAIDCSTLTEGLADAELFGHVRGAFTGAVGSHGGLFGQADGGTLFLDEVGNASLPLQARLLRVLETGEVRAVGSQRLQPVDVRVIAATNRDLHADADSGRFRRDLLLRLDVLQVRLPALRERPGDIEELAEHLLARMATRDARRYSLAPEAGRALMMREWLGSVRELRNVLEEAAVAAGGDVIESCHLPARRAGATARPLQHLPWDQWLAREERAYLLDHLEARGWNRSATARDLGISRQALYDRIKKHGLWPRLLRPEDGVGTVHEGP